MQVFHLIGGNEKQYAYVAGFQRTIVSKLLKCCLLAQCFNLPQKPAIIAYYMLCSFILLLTYFLNLLDTAQILAKSNYISQSLN